MSTEEEKGLDAIVDKGEKGAGERRVRGMRSEWVGLGKFLCGRGRDCIWIFICFPCYVHERPNHISNRDR